MKLSNIIKDGSIIESLENYAVTDLLDGKIGIVDKRLERQHFYDDNHFWRNIIDNPEDYWDKQLQFSNFAFSDWVPRVPGLGYTRAARIISHNLRDVIPLNRNRRIYRPNDKSGFVMSGVGSLKIPPDYKGYKLTCITSSSSSSKGIPMLISPEVIEHHGLRNGDMLESVVGLWQKMTTDWVRNFAITEHMIRGYLVINHPKQIQKSDVLSDFYYDPYSIMEYEQDGILKWDYVFCNVPVSGRNQQKDIERFFREYQAMNGVQGKYLINPDIGEPLFETEYNSPADLRKEYAQAQLALIKERMNHSAVEGLQIDQLTAKIADAYQDPYSLRVFAKKCGINVGLITEDAPVKMAVQIVHLAINSKLLLELVQRLLIEQ